MKKIFFVLTVILFGEATVCFAQQQAPVKSLDTLYSNISKLLVNRIIRIEKSLRENIFGENYYGQRLQISITPMIYKPTGGKTTFSEKMAQEIASRMNSQINKGPHYLKYHIYSSDEYKIDTTFHYNLSMQYSLKGKQLILENIKLNSHYGDHFDLSSIAIRLSKNLIEEIKRLSQERIQYDANLSFILNFEREANLIKKVTFKFNSGSTISMLYSNQFGKIYQIPTNKNFTITIETTKPVYIYIISYDPEYDKNPYFLYPMPKEKEEKLNYYEVKSIYFSENSGMYNYFKIIASENPLDLKKEKLFGIKVLEKREYYKIKNPQNFINYLQQLNCDFETKTYTVNVIKN